MNSWSYIRRSLVHYRWIHLAVLLSVATATAVLTGALLVGDSVRGSLRELGLGRLGRIDHTLISERFFDLRRFEALVEKTEFQGFAAAPACIAASTTVEHRDSERDRGADAKLRRATNVLLIGCDDRFWQLGDTPAPKTPMDKEVVINQSLAEECGATVGDLITIRLPGANPVPADSPLGRKDDRVSSLIGLKVIQIVPNSGLGEFAIHPTQQAAQNAWVSLDIFARAVDQPGRINAILIESVSNRIDTELEVAQLNDLLDLEFGDFGLSISRETRRFGDRTIWDYWNLTSDRMVWDAAARDAVAEILADAKPQEVFTYLANTIFVDRAETAESSAKTTARVEIPYSIIAALDNHPQLGPLQDAEGKILPPLANDEIALNRWAADRLQAQIGDSISIHYFAPETLHGSTQERTATFRLTAIVALTEPDDEFRRNRPPTFRKAPTLANDPALTPTVAGVTDQASINDWDPPFPFDSDRIQPIDEEYWDRHRTTPKAYIPLAAGKRLWTSRLGITTSFRVPVVGGMTEADLGKSLTAGLKNEQVRLGYQFQPLRARTLEASAGTTPFEYLFLGFSMFLMASAVMLIAALFRLGLDLRAQEFGTLVANGIGVNKIRRLASGELAIVAMVGAGLGIFGGILYAATMIFGLRTWWLEAVVTPFLRLHIQPASLVIGFALSTLAAWAVVWRGLARLSSASPTELLAGRFSSMASDLKSPHALPTDHVPKKRRLPILRVLIALATIIGVLGVRLSGEAQAGAFFGSGALALSVIVAAIYRSLKRRGESEIATGNAMAQLSPLGLAWRNAARYPGRSTLTIGLMAAASFLILAIAAFRLAPTAAGTGGFALIAGSDQPIYADLSLAEVRNELFGTEGAAVLNDTDILRLRKRAGDDASCRNLFQSAQPELLGISDQVIDYFDEHPDLFAWAGAATTAADDGAVSKDRVNHWHCLSSSSNGDFAANDADTIPVVIDKNTAMYALHLPPKIGYEFTLKYEDVETPLRFRIAGLLGGTILQGSLLIPEADLVRVFPETGGYRSFLIRVDSEDAGHIADVASRLENRFSDEGLDVQDSAKVLRGLLAVQNTYLSTFQSLGALGLLLGAVGLVAVQIRQVIARRSELALMTAMGMSPGWIQKQLIRENGVLLVAGLGSGIAAAAVALIPHQLLGAARFPIVTLSFVFGGILILALVSAAIAARLVAAQSIVASLRGD